ncbi:family 78 glycoside hydrolase catalytic domain [Nocardia goodfellowii]
MTKPTHPTRLRIEHGPRSLGIGVARPRLSWWLPEGTVRQDACEIEAIIDGADRRTAVLADDRSVLRPWPFSDLESRSQVAWRVRVRTTSGWSAWSDSDHFETGLLDPAQWQAQFIGGTDPDPLPAVGDRPALYLRRRLHLDERPTRARAYVTAHGLYELHLDGNRVGDLELTPGFTSYRTNLNVQTYDITDALTPGEHELVATVTDGWWRGSTGFMHLDRTYGSVTALLAQIELYDRSGTRTVIGTGTEWEVCAEGPIRGADLMSGQRYDQTVGFPPAHGWKAAVVHGIPDATLTVSPAPPTRRVTEYRPVSVRRLDTERQVVDLGANINGWVRVAGSALGPAGRVVRLRHGERLGDDGDIDTRHLEPPSPLTGQPMPVGMVDEVISDGTGTVFEPRHTTHGFQYVGIEGAEDLTAEDISGVLVHTDMRRTGRFRCSDDRLNAVHEAAVLSFRGNACEIPTDCPQRERSGWTGDWQLFFPTAAFLYDVAGFSQRWLRDLAADQLPDGRVPNIVPNTLPTHSNRVIEMAGSAGWGDAAVHIPYQQWQLFGDAEILACQYDSMRAWVEFALTAAAGDRHPARRDARADPAPHEKFLWDTGFHWGEWLEPVTDVAEAAPHEQGDFDHSCVTTAYLYRSLTTMADTAALLDRDTDADRYRGLAQQVGAAWRTEFRTDDGTISHGTQANLARALAFGLIEDSGRRQVAAELVRKIRAAGNHLGTGFLATPFLLPVLADHGYQDVAYDVLLETTPPSWLHMIESGSSTVWEHWEGLDATGIGSLNHYSKGAVISFLHQYVAGVRPVPGQPAYRRFEVKPCPGGGITFAAADLDTPYGPISSRWTRTEREFDLHVRVAPGTEAEVSLPDGSVHTRGPGDHEFTVRTDNT